MYSNCRGEPRRRWGGDYGRRQGARTPPNSIPLVRTGSPRQFYVDSQSRRADRQMRTAIPVSVIVPEITPTVTADAWYLVSEMSTADVAAPESECRRYGRERPAEFRNGKRRAQPQQPVLIQLAGADGPADFVAVTAPDLPAEGQSSSLSRQWCSYITSRSETRPHTQRSRTRPVLVRAGAPNVISPGPFRQFECSRRDPVTPRVGCPHCEGLSSRPTPCGQPGKKVSRER